MMISLFVFLIFFFLYLTGVSPTLYGGDSGEFIASAHVLGIAHAPGYPLYVILGKAATILIPFGDISLRINIFSAFISALVIVVSIRFFQNISVGKSGFFAGLLSAMCLGMTPLFADQAHSAEVFNLNLLFIVLILASAKMCWVHRDSEDFKTWIYLAFFLWGLGFGNHHTILFVSPVLLWLAWKGRANGALFLGMIFFFIFLGFSVYLFLPIRAGMNPAVNFGDPETWSRFWGVVRRKEFGSLSLHPASVPYRDWELVIGQLTQFLRRILSQVGWMGLGFMALGFGTGICFKETRWLVIAGFLSFLLFGPAFEVYSNLSPGSSIAQWRLERFFMVPLFCAFVLIGTFFFQLFRKGVYLRGAGIILVTLFLVGESRSFFQASSLRNNFSFHDFSIAALRSAPFNSWLVIDRILFDEPTSALLVRTRVAGKRNDVRFLYRPGTLFESPYGKDILELSWPERYRREVEVEKRFLSGSTEAVRCLAFNKANAPFPNPQMAGLLYRPASSAKNLFGTFAPVRWRHEPPVSDYPRKLIQVHFAYLFGKEALDKGEWILADKFFLSARNIGQDMAWLDANIGSIYAQLGRIKEAESLFARAGRIDPFFFEAQYGLGYVRLRNNDLEGAVSSYEKAVRLSPHSPDAFYMLGIAYERAGKSEEARASFEKFIEFSPDGPQVRAVRDELKKMR